MQQQFIHTATFNNRIYVWKGCVYHIVKA